MLFPVEGEMVLWQLMKKRWDSPFLWSLPFGVSGVFFRNPKVTQGTTRSPEGPWGCQCVSDSKTADRDKNAGEV